MDFLDSNYSGHQDKFKAAKTTALTAAVDAAEAYAAANQDTTNASLATHAAVVYDRFEDSCDDVIRLRGTDEDRDGFTALKPAIISGDVETVANALDRWVGLTQPWVVKTRDLNRDIDFARARLNSLIEQRRDAARIALSQGSTPYQLAAVTGETLDEVESWID